MVSLELKFEVAFTIEMSLKVHHSNKPAVQELGDVAAVNGVA